MSSQNKCQLICRTCLKTYKNFHCIFESYKDKKQSISDVLMDCTAIKIKRDDCLPTNICDVCLDILSSIYNFRVMVVESDAKLQNFNCNEIDKELPSSDASDMCIIKEDFTVTYIAHDPINNSDNYDINEENTIAIEKNTSFLTENMQSKGIKKDVTIMKTEGIEMKDETDDNNIKIQDFYGKNSSSSGSFVSLLYSDGNENRDKELSSDEDSVELTLLNSKRNKRKYDEVQSVQTENMQKKLSKKDCSNVNLMKTDNMKVKKETDENNVEMHDFSDEDSLSSDFLISLLCDNESDFQNKQKGIQNEQLPNDKGVVKEPPSRIKKNEKCLEEFEENNTPRESLDLSEYEHMKATLTYAEKKKAKVLCKLCKKSCGYKYFPVHIRRHLGEIPYKCDVCGKSFVQPIVLRYHMKTHVENKPYTCEVCNTSFKTLGSLNSHKLVHTNDPVACDICNKQFKHKTALVAHVRRHDNSEQQCVCELCGKSLSNIHVLRKHIATHTNAYNYKCVECNKYFKTQILLSCHKKRHSNKRPHVCSICGKSFKDKKVLRMHVSIHSQAKPFSCKICGKTFRQASCLPRHMRIHTGETPFSCEKCPAVFKYSHHLKNHMKRHK